MLQFKVIFAHSGNQYVFHPISRKTSQYCFRSKNLLSNLLLVGMLRPNRTCSCVCFCLYGPFNCISLCTFSQQLSAFSLCSSGLFFSALLVLSTIYLFMKVSPSPDIILCGWLGLKHQLTNYQFFRQLSVFWLFFRSYLCLTGPFNFISLYESLLQPWYNP